MVQRYLQILAEGLDKKTRLLEQVLMQCNLQSEIAKQQPMNLSMLDETFAAKEGLIKEIDVIDAGFEQVYDRIREELQDHKAEYADSIKEIQGHIRRVTDLRVSIEAAEERNRVLITKAFRSEREQLQRDRSKSKAALDYYTSMNRVNYVDPQMLDQKK